MEDKSFVAIILTGLLTAVTICCSVTFAEDRDQALLEAAKRGDLKLVQDLIKKGADVNARDHSGATALHKAAWAKNGTDVVKCLLDNGVDVNAKDSSGRTALLEAISGWNYTGQSLGLLELLLDRGANVNAKTLTGKTPLMEAAAGDHQMALRKWYHVIVDELRYRLFGKQWIGLVPPGMRTPEVVEFLLDKGADVNAEDRQGWTALKRAQCSIAPCANDIVALLKAHGAKE